MNHPNMADHIFELEVIRSYFGSCECEISKVQLNTHGFKFNGIRLKERSTNWEYDITIPHHVLFETLVAWGTDLLESIIILGVSEEASSRISGELKLPKGCLNGKLYTYTFKQFFVLIHSSNTIERGSLRICFESSNISEKSREIIKQLCCCSNREPFRSRSYIKEINYLRAKLIERECKNGTIFHPECSSTRSIKGRGASL